MKGIIWTNYIFQLMCGVGCDYRILTDVGNPSPFLIFKNDVRQLIIFRITTCADCLLKKASQNSARHQNRLVEVHQDRDN